MLENVDRFESKNAAHFHRPYGWLFYVLTKPVYKVDRFNGTKTLHDSRLNLLCQLAVNDRVRPDRLSQKVIIV